ncbi:MAG: oligopeptide/dipeptide transporter, ATPase subunit [Chloroflexi bacterium]|nr:oligopeptide/dipeptide transporter, ATPase subunit [Chloroflexota bacterium]
MKVSPVLRVEDLYVDFDLRAGRLTAVDGISLSLDRGETLGIVGESGSGKTVTALAIMGLLESPGRARQGHVWLGEEDLLQLPEARLERLRGRKIAMVFQEPMTSLNPVLTIGEQLAEVYQQHLGLPHGDAMDESARMLERVRLPDARGVLRKYPHELSGGMRQRAMIGAALACGPDILIADEPTTALDVTIQAQILSLLAEVQAEMGMGLVLISHNLGVVAQVCRRVAVMYAGNIVEEGATAEIFRSPGHPYTAGLLASVPRRSTPLQGIRGAICDLLHPPTGCRFHPRCPKSAGECEETSPVLSPRSSGRVACFFPNG